MKTKNNKMYKTNFFIRKKKHLKLFGIFKAHVSEKRFYSYDYIGALNKLSILAESIQVNNDQSYLNSHFK